MLDVNRADIGAYTFNQIEEFGFLQEVAYDGNVVTMQLLVH